MLFALLGLAALVIPIVLFDQYLLARSQRFTEQHRTEMTRFRALLG